MSSRRRTKLSRETFDSGNYVIKGCAGQTVQVILLLQQTIRGVRKPLKLLTTLIPPGTTVYNRFFDGVDPNKIKGILSKVAAGPRVYLQGVLHKPLITCTRPNVAELASTWVFCSRRNQLSVQFLYPIPLGYPCAPESSQNKKHPAQSTALVNLVNMAKPTDTYWRRLDSITCFTSWFISTLGIRLYIRRSTHFGMFSIYQLRNLSSIRQAMCPILQLSYRSLPHTRASITLTCAGRYRCRLHGF